VFNFAQSGSFVISFDRTAKVQMSGAREAIFPTRMALSNTKLRLKGAQTGHSLLAKKRDALMTRFRAILRKVDEVGGIDSLYCQLTLLFPYFVICTV